MDLWDVDIRRCMPFQRNRRYLKDRTVEALGLLYAMHWPFRQPRPRAACGARRCMTACWRGVPASASSPDGSGRTGSRRRASSAEYDYSYGRQNWFAYSAAEHRAVREGVGLFDQSSFGKFVVEGADAEAVLNRISANDIAVPVGKIVYTQWLNERGGIEADLTITREAETGFLIVTAAATRRAISPGCAAVPRPSASPCSTRPRPMRYSASWGRTRARCSQR